MTAGASSVWGGAAVSGTDEGDPAGADAPEDEGDLAGAQAKSESAKRASEMCERMKYFVRQET